MELNANRLRQLIREFDFQRLFLEELGWDAHQAALEIRLDGRTFPLSGLAQKRGMVVYQFPAPSGESIPEYPMRRKIEKQVARHAHEHIIIFTDPENSTQIWQWVKREPGKPSACREHTYHQSQPGEALIQKLRAIAFALNEEENLTLTDVTRRVRASLDVERVTKRFYDRFKKEHAVFLKFIIGITESADRDWYASVMLNRLMFVYFIQRKGFLNGDRDYLRNRLSMTRKEYGQDKFYSFYRYFLLRLFHEGLGGRKRTPALEKLLGKIPYLNGGLFEIHPVEQRYSDIQIPDRAFESIFSYFDEYHWHLDERPLRADNEINPDVLGYIFEKYINQKQMGAYYTREDITEYIAKNTVIPFLFDAARTKCKVAFENPGGPTLWDLLKTDPDWYIYPAVRHGTDIPLPSEIAEGIDTVKPGLLERRKGWNRFAPIEVALPTESWREVVARRQRCEELRRKLGSGEVHDINDLISLNLDIRQFAQDVIENSEGPELLRAFWHAIEQVTVLDPTCGSGAFLFAALNILEPLYQSCLDRMEAFVEDLDRSGQKYRPEKFSDFREVLERVSTHPNPRYFIFKSIILNNLFGVDIMEEAVEICKLRLFLKLAAQVEPNAAGDNLGIEPLPDVDFNIRSGNTLVGYATADEVRRVLKEKPCGKRVQYNLMFGDKQDSYDRLNDQLKIVDSAFNQFRAMQTQQSIDAKEFAEIKLTLRRRLNELEDELNRYLAGEYGVELVSLSGRKTKGQSAAYQKWLKSHEPFHWFIEFYGIMQRGGFDVIIGNPPYVVNTPEKVNYRIQERLFSCFACKNLFAFVCERSIHLSHNHSMVGLIVQLTALSSEKMSKLQDLFLNRGLLLAPSFPRRPESVFDGVEMPVTILISRSKRQGIYTSRINRFYSEERPHALSVMSLSDHNIRLHGHRIAKFGTNLEISVFKKINQLKQDLKSLVAQTPDNIFYYQEACRYWVKACKGYPFFRRNNELITPPHGRTISFKSKEACAFATCLINSSLFYWFYSAFSDCEHINDALIRGFSIPESWDAEDWSTLEKRLSKALRQNSQRKTITTKEGHKIEYDELNASKSIKILAEIDQILAQHYGTTDEELDFIINYDIKYRMGRGGDSEEE